MSEIKFSGDYFNWESIRRTKQYMDTLTMGVFSSLENLELDVSFDEIYSHSSSVEELTSYLETKGWKEKVNLDTLIAEVDEFYAKNQSRTPEETYKSIVDSALKQGTITQEERDRLLSRMKKEPEQ